MLRYLILLLGFNLALQAQIEIEIDTGEPKDTGKTIDIPGPTNGNGFEGPKQFAQKKAMDDVIKLKSGDTLHGNLISHQTKMGVTWIRPGIKGPIVFDEKNLRGIKLFKQNSIKPKGAYVYLTNDDVLYGQVISLDKDNLKFKTWYAGELTIPKVMIRSILPGSTEGPVILNGPGNIKEWQQYGNWKIEGKKLITSSNGTIGKSLDLPDKIAIELDLQWTGSYPQIFIIPYTQSIQNYYSHGYNIRIYRSSLQLYQGNNRRLSNSVSFDFSKAKKIKMNILIDKTKKNVVVYINNKKLGDWKNVQYTPNGKSLVLYAGSSGQTTFENLKIRKWDGKVPNAINNKEAKGDMVVFKNGDKMSGNVLSINNGVVKLKTDFAEMPVPIKNITQMSFNNEDLIRARRNKNDVKAYFAGGNSITFGISRIEKNQIYASSENFGDIKLDMNAFVGLLFNIYDGDEAGISNFETFVYSD